MGRLRKKGPFTVADYADLALPTLNTLVSVRFFEYTHSLQRSVRIMLLPLPRRSRRCQTV